MERLQILVAFVVSLGVASGASLGVLQIEGGSVQGENIPTGLSRSVDVFKGIPFAAKPGIFEKPKRHPGWDGILEATKYAPSCLQMNFSQTSTDGSEDCLYLNIWVPQGEQVSSNLPVMIWIHGGGFLTGSAFGSNIFGSYSYDGQGIADRGNVIVVSVGYRLGVVGFLSTGDSGIPGNYGLWDQHESIAWVHRNIRSFGGDPENITLFGESAGGASVSFQMHSVLDFFLKEVILSTEVVTQLIWEACEGIGDLTILWLDLAKYTLTPYNKGLYRRAISQSGVALCPWALVTNPRKRALEVAEKVGCPTDDSMVACLRSKDAKTLTMAGPLTQPGTPEYPSVNYMYMSPVVDGDFLPDHPANLFHNAADIDYLSGVNNMDGHIFTSQDFPSFLNKNHETPVEEVKTLLATFTKDKGKAGMELTFAEYSSQWQSSSIRGATKKTAVEIETDYAFLSPAQTAIFLHKNNARTGRTYSYLLSEQSPLAGPDKLYYEWMGADHTDDVPYVFGKPFTTPGLYTDRQRDLSSYFIAYWTNFAKTGDPNKGSKPVPVVWPEFSSSGQQYLDINSNMNENSIGQYMRLRYVHLWTKALQSLPSYTTDH